MNAYIESWKLGLKAVAIYRDGSKRVQPLSTGEKKGAVAGISNCRTKWPVRFGAWGLLV
jgi:ribonucleotide reductase alpha subunit